MDNHFSPTFFKQLYQFETVYCPTDVDSFKVWILVNYPQMELAPEASLAFLHKILAAMQLQSQHFRISNIASTTTWENYSQEATVPYQQVWAFGDCLTKIIPVLPTQPNYVPQMHEDIIYLGADTLETLQNNAELKKQLWAVLQQLK